MSPTILGGFTKHLKANQLVIIGAALFGVGYILSGFVANIAMLFVVYGLMTGVGTGLMYPTMMGYSASVFPEKTGIASGLFAGVYGGSAMLWSPILANMIAGRGMRQAFIIIGAACLVILVICGAIIRPVPEGYVEYKRAQDSGAGDQPNEDADAPSRVVKDLNRGQMVKTS